MFKDQKEYWEARYRSGRNSGCGSVDENRKWKWNIIESTLDHRIISVIDYGCGDLSFWKLSFWKRKECIDYIGIDVSLHQLAINRKSRPTWKFVEATDIESVEPRPVVLCMDVLFHIIPEDDYLKVIENLIKLSTDYIFIHTWINNPFKHLNRISDGKYQIFREFDKYFPIFNDHGFKLQSIIENPIDHIGALYIFRKDSELPTSK